MLLGAESRQFQCLRASLNDVIRHPRHAKQLDVDIRLLGCNGHFVNLIDDTAPRIIDLGDNFIALALKIARSFSYWSMASIRFLHIYLGLLGQAMFCKLGSDALFTTHAHKTRAQFK